MTRFTTLAFRLSVLAAFALALAAPWRWGS